MTASASDDGTVVLYNHSSFRLEGTLVPEKDPSTWPEVKICKFIPDTDIVVTADLDGYINFYARPPNKLKNRLLLRKIHYNKHASVVSNGKKS